MSKRALYLVTGASEGIGLALAHRFACGMQLPVVMIARSTDPLSEAARAVAASTNVETVALPLDITQTDAIEAIDQELTARRLHAEIVINNAGIGLGGPFTDHDETALAGLLDLNVRALTLLTRRLLPAMVKRGHGSIINVGSLGGFAPGPYQAAYYASKAYVLSLSRALAFEVADHGVHVCCVTPGPVDTKFHARMGAETALYRQLMPAMSARAVANSAWRGWRLGFYVIPPGIFAPALSFAMRLMPWLITVPVIGWLLAKRYRKAS